MAKVSTCGVGWGWLPLGVVLLMSGSMVITYVIAVLNGNVAALFPYISDAGSSLPESSIFAQFLNTAACVATFTLVLRFWTIMDLIGESQCIGRLSKVAVVFGVLASFGLSIVGNFQADKIPVVHFTGAFLVFCFGEVYCVLDTVVTYKMAPQYNSRSKAHVRLVISVVGFLAIISTIISELVSTWQARNSGVTIIRKHWQEENPGYTAHVMAAFSEWTVCVAFIFYFMYFIGDFRRMDVGLRLHYHGGHVSVPANMVDTHKMEANGNANGNVSVNATNRTSVTNGTSSTTSNL